MLTDIGCLIERKACKRWIGCILILAISVFLSGCWDRYELQDKNFVIGIAIDQEDKGLGPGQGEEVTRVENFIHPDKRKMYRLSLQLLQLTPSNNREGSGGRGKPTSRIISTTGESMSDMIWDLVSQSNKKMSFEHLQTIVISDAAIRQRGLQPLLDFFNRSEEIRWLTKVVMTHGEARPLLEYKPPTGELSGMFITNSLRQYNKNPHIAGWQTDVGSIMRDQDNKKRVLIPHIELMDNVMKIGGMAIFKEGKLIDYVDEYVTMGGKLISGIEKSAIITFECPTHPKKLLTFEVFSHVTKLTPHVDKGAIYFTLDIVMKGNIGEMQCRAKHDTIEDEDIEDLEILAAQAVEKNILYTHHTYQSLKVDAAPLRQKLEAFEPQVWDEVKDHWDDEVFPKTPLVVSVNVHIENLGNHK